MNKGTKTTVGLAAVGFMAVFVSFTPKLSPEMERRLMAEHQQREAAKEAAWKVEQEANCRSAAIQSRIDCPWRYGDLEQKGR